MIVDHVIETGECRLRRGHRRRASAAGDRRDHGRPAGRPPQAVRVVEPHDRRGRPRVHGRRQRNAFVELFAYANELADERRTDPRDDIVTKLLERRDRRRQAQRARVRHVHAAARGGRQRDHPQRDRARHVRAPHQPRAVRPAQERPRGPHRRRGRGDPALGVAGAALPAHRDRRHRDPRSGRSRRATGS